jgi:hypothetical protein
MSNGSLPFGPAGNHDFEDPAEAESSRKALWVGEKASVGADWETTAIVVGDTSSEEWISFTEGVKPLSLEEWR